MQLLMGMSMRRYFPAIGTAGFERILVNGCRRDPRPPPIMTPRTSFIDGIAAPLPSLRGVFATTKQSPGSVRLPRRLKAVRNDMYCYYLLILKSWRSFAARNTKGYAKMIRTSIRAKIRDNLIAYLHGKSGTVTIILFYGVES